MSHEVEGLDQICVALLNGQHVVKTFPFDHSVNATPVDLSRRRLTDCCGAIAFKDVCVKVE